MLANPNKFCKTNDRFALEVCLKFAKSLGNFGAFLFFKEDFMAKKKGKGGRVPKC